MFGRLKIAHRLYGGFALIVLLFAVSIVTTLWQVGQIDAITQRVIAVRSPTAVLATDLTAQVQGSLAALRGYLLTGNQSFKLARASNWSAIDSDSQRMTALSKDWTDPANKQAWADVTATAAEFRKAQDETEALYSATDIKPAVTHLINEAAPRADKLLDILAGPDDANGVRNGGMVGNQRALLDTDNAAIGSATDLLNLVQWTLLGLGVLLGAAIAFLTGRSISSPLAGMTRAMARLADNDVSFDVPARNRRDEIGEMAAAVEVFKQNAIRVRDLNAAEAERAALAQQRATAMSALVGELGAVVTAAVDGDLDKRIEAQFEDDDLKSVASGVNDLVATVARGIGETGAVLAAVAHTDLTRRVDGHFKGAFANLKHDTNAVVDNLAGLVRQLRKTSGQLRTATSEILSGANDLSERTTRQAAAIEETSAATEQLASTVAENARRAESASARADAASRTAESTGEVMRRSNDAMERISASSAKISNIIGLIDDIAFQTNLLALNASVEAARAGEAGKGFAVVAIEVRRLAQSAAQASSEVKQLIEQSTTEVSAGTRLVAEATHKLASMLDEVRESAGLIRGISGATNEQSSAISEVSTTVRQMDEMTQHNAALVEETNAAIEQTEAQAVELDRMVEVFVLEEAAPPAKVRASRAA